MPDLPDPRTAEYILRMTRFNDPLLAEMEARAERDGFPIIGPLVGPWLYTLTRMIGGTRVFELGSGYGYSTWYFCKAVADQGGGTVVHTVWDAQLSADAHVNLERAGFSSITQFIEDEAVAALRQADGGWDVIFMDIDKEGYPGALEVIEQKLRPGGLLIVDNLIWSGAVLDRKNATDPQDERPTTLAIRKLTEMLRDSPRWEFLLLPLRDGVGVARFSG